MTVINANSKNTEKNHIDTSEHKEMFKKVVKKSTHLQLQYESDNYKTCTEVNYYSMHKETVQFSYRYAHVFTRLSATQHIAVNEKFNKMNSHNEWRISVISGWSHCVSSVPWLKVHR